MIVVVSNLTHPVYYHGTKSQEEAMSILQSGIQPPAITSKGWLVPIKGMVYVTPDIAYALIYALGGDYAGHDPYLPFIEKYGPYGYVFAIDPTSMQTVQPDEDSVGKLLSSKKAPDWLRDLALRYVAPSRLRKLMHGEYIYYASVGKQLLRLMPDYRKRELANLPDVHVAHAGKLIPRAAWKVDKKRSHEYKSDGSNFFDISEKVL